MPEPHALTRAQTRRFVIVFVIALVALAVFATVSILRGQSDAGLQEQVEVIEAQRQRELPRLDARPGEPASADSP